MGPAFFDDPAPRPASIGRLAALGTGVCAVGIVIVGLAAEPFLGWFAAVTLLP